MYIYIYMYLKFYKFCRVPASMFVPVYILNSMCEYQFPTLLMTLCIVGRIRYTICSINVTLLVPSKVGHVCKGLSDWVSLQ